MMEDEKRRALWQAQFKNQGMTEFDSSRVRQTGGARAVHARCARSAKGVWKDFVRVAGAARCGREMSALRNNLRRASPDFNYLGLSRVQPPGRFSGWALVGEIKNEQRLRIARWSEIRGLLGGRIKPPRRLVRRCGCGWRFRWGRRRFYHRRFCRCVRPW